MFAQRRAFRLNQRHEQPALRHPESFPHTISDGALSPKGKRFAQRAGIWPSDSCFKSSLIQRFDIYATGCSSQGHLLGKE
ncbi:hypothetical protein FGO68_gene11100 [Halteria grandinella]|uniref:Uncharacterized protein n=1 Tax=Halteria grandinella TaxID=5974 RepID=A0A8J8SU80_HALGN|nr:hypothetical protein FGO68_gene11100 [Halteria grandinella]